MVQLFTADATMAIWVGSQTIDFTVKTLSVRFSVDRIYNQTEVSMRKKLVVVKELRNLGIEKKNFISRGFESSDSYDDSSQRKERRDNSPFTVAAGERREVKKEG